MARRGITDAGRAAARESHSMQSTPLLRHLTVGDVMHGGTVTCSPSSDPVEVAAVMAEHGIHCIVAIDEGPPGEDDDRLWGVVSDLDVMRGIGSGSGLDAGNLAELDVATAAPGDTLERAAETMVRRQLAHLVVVADGRPVGVISTLDIMRAVSEHCSSASGTARWRPPTRPILRSRP